MLLCRAYRLTLLARRSGVRHLPEDMGMPGLQQLHLRQCMQLEHLPLHGMTCLTSLTLLDMYRLGLPP